MPTITSSVTPLPPMLKNSIIACFVALLIIPAQHAFTQTESERVYSDTYYILDVSGSMVNSILGELKEEKIGGEPIVSIVNTESGRPVGKISPQLLEKYLQKPTNKRRYQELLDENILHKCIRQLEEIIDDAGEGKVTLITFSKGFHTLGNAASISPIFSVNIKGYGDREAKTKFKQFLSPEKWGSLPGHPEWRGVLNETMIKTGNYTFIHSSVQKAIAMLRQQLSDPARGDKIRSQTLYLFTDGHENEEGQEFEQLVEMLVEHRDTVPYFVYEEIYLNTEKFTEEHREKLNQRKNTLNEAGFTGRESEMEKTISVSAETRTIEAEILEGATDGSQRSTITFDPPLHVNIYDGAGDFAGTIPLGIQLDSASPQLSRLLTVRPHPIKVDKNGSKQVIKADISFSPEIYEQYGNQIIPFKLTTNSDEIRVEGMSGKPFYSTDGFPINGKLTITKLPVISAQPDFKRRQGSWQEPANRTSGELTGTIKITPDLDVKLADESGKSVSGQLNLSLDNNSLNSRDISITLPDNKKSVTLSGRPVPVSLNAKFSEAYLDQLRGSESVQTFLKWSLSPKRSDEKYRLAGELEGRVPITIQLSGKQPAVTATFTPSDAVTKDMVRLEKGDVVGTLAVNLSRSKGSKVSANLQSTGNAFTFENGSEAVTWEGTKDSVSANIIVRDIPKSDSLNLKIGITGEADATIEPADLDYNISITPSIVQINWKKGSISGQVSPETPASIDFDGIIDGLLGPDHRYAYESFCVFEVVNSDEAADAPVIDWAFEGDGSEYFELVKLEGENSVPVSSSMLNAGAYQIRLAIDSLPTSWSSLSTNFTLSPSNDLIEFDESVGATPLNIPVVAKRAPSSSSNLSGILGMLIALLTIGGVIALILMKKPAGAAKGLMIVNLSEVDSEGNSLGHSRSVSLNDNHSVALKDDGSSMSFNINAPNFTIRRKGNKLVLEDINDPRAKPITLTMNTPNQITTDDGVKWVQLSSRFEYTDEQ